MRWETFFSIDVPYCAFADGPLDEKEFAKLVLDTHKAIMKYLPEKATEPLRNYNQVLSLFGWLKAYSLYPTFGNGAVTLGFDASKEVIRQLVINYETPREHCEVDFNNFEVPLMDLPEEYAKEESDGLTYLPFSLIDFDLAPIKNALFVRDKELYTP